MAKTLILIYFILIFNLICFNISITFANDEQSKQNISNNNQNQTDSSNNSVKKEPNNRFLKYRKEFELMNKEYSNNDQQNCFCDWLINYCDIECCCDLNCTLIEKYSFRKCQPNIDNDYHQQQHHHHYQSNRCYTSTKHNPLNYPGSPSMLCLAKDNIKVREWIDYKMIVTDKIQLLNVEHKHKFVWTSKPYSIELNADNNNNNNAPISIRNISVLQSLVKYKSGNKLARFILKKNNTMVQYYYWKLPFSSLFKNEQCNHFKHVRYLYNFHSTCLRNIMNLERICTMDPYLDYRIYFNADLFLFDQLNNDTSYKFVPIQNDGRYFNATYWDRTTNICHNVVEKITFIVWHEGINGIRRVNITINQIDLPVGQRKEFLQQTFNVTFLWFNRPNQYPERQFITEPTTGNNIGYMFGREILFWSSAGNDTEKRRPIVKTLLDLNPNGICSANVHNHSKINFGINRLTTCRLMIDLVDSRQNICSIVQSRIGKYLDYQYLDNNNDNNIYITSLIQSNIDYQAERWVKIIDLNENSTKNSIDINNNNNNNNVCNVITGILYRFHVVKFHQLHYQIIGADFNLIFNKFNMICTKNTTNKTNNNNNNNNNNNTDHNQCRITTQLVLMAAVNFIDKSKPFVPDYAPGPSVKIELPSDFFYPFVVTSSSIQSTSTLSSSSSSKLTATTASIISHFNDIYLICFLCSISYYFHY